MAIVIAETACVAPSAELAEDVEIGPYCVIGPEVKIGRGTRLIAHVCLLGSTELGAGNLVSPFAVLGGDPQDTAYKGEPTRLVIGDRNIIREGVTINRGSPRETGLTRIGSHNTFMAGVHIAHDCVIEDHVSIANATLLGGSVEIESFSTISAGATIHPQATIGGYSFVGGQCRIIHDVPPFMLVDGQPSRARCINIIGLKRHGVTPDAIDALHEAHRLLYRARMNMPEAAALLESHGHLTPEVKRLLDFLNRQVEGRHGRGRERARRA